MGSSIRIAPASTRLDADLTLPGSKSYTNRALIIAALAQGTSVINGVSHSRDSMAMVDALRKFGVAIDEQGAVARVHGRGRKLEPFHGEIDVGPAGTTMRFLTALAAVVPGSEIVLKGSERMHQRPIADLVDALRALGAKIEYLGLDGCPPLRVNGFPAPATRSITVDASKSSQFLSALLLVAPALGVDLSIAVPGEFVSQSYVEMTMDSMRSFGAVIGRSGSTFSISGSRPYRAGAYEVECDASGCSYLWGLAAVAQGRIRILGVNPRSAQGDIGFPALLEKMGCTVRSGEHWIEVQRSGQLRGITADMTLMPDTAQTLAVIAAYAVGDTTITGLSTLRIKETDRLLALKTELAKIGVVSEISPDSITVTGSAPRHAVIATYEDHRMAMSFALCGSTPSGISIEDPEVVNKSFPEFWGMVRELGLTITEE